MKKVFKEIMSFSAAELRSQQICLGAVGVSIPRAADDDLSEYDCLPFGSLFSSMNDPKFYEGLTAQGVIPKEEDFIQHTFRLISATIVGGGTWKAADFSNTKVLKASTNKLRGKPVYKEHETEVDNWVGKVSGVKWTAEATQKGIKVPAGIDGVLSLDAKTNPKVVRGVLYGVISSNSVTVATKWTMSHQFETLGEFYDKVGTLGEDGKMVRRIVEEVEDYYETSLVWLGADPFAKARQEDGTLKDIDTRTIFQNAATSFSKSHDMGIDVYAKESDEHKAEAVDLKKLDISFALDENVLSLNQPRDRKIIPVPNKDTEMKDFIIAFIAAFGEGLNIKEGTEPTEKEMTDYIVKLSITSSDEEIAEALSNKTLVDTMGTMALTASKEKDDKVDKVEDISKFMGDHVFIGTEDLRVLREDAGKVESLKADAKVGQEFLSMKRTEAIRLYKVAVGEDKFSEPVVKLFQEADSTAVDGLLEQYVQKATTKFSGVCAKCDSKEFKFQSTLSPSGDGKEVKEVGTMTTQNFRDKYKKSGMNISAQPSEGK